MSENFTCEIQSRIRDANLGGHVDSVEAIRVLDEARMRFFTAAVLPHCPADVKGLVAAQHVNYLSEMRFAGFQPFEVRMWIGHIGRTSFTVESELKLSGVDDVAIRAETSVVMWSTEQEQSWEHGPELLAALQRHLDEPVPLRERATKPLN